MSQLPDLIAVALRPIMIIGVAAVIYKIGRLLLPSKKTAAISFFLTAALFVIDLISIRIPALRLLSTFSTMVGFVMLAFIFRKKFRPQD